MDISANSMMEHMDNFPKAVTSYLNQVRKGLSGWRVLVVALSYILITPVLADQRAAELPDLFEQLQSASNSSQARAIESSIWQHWLDSPNESSGLLMSQVNLAMQADRLDVALILSNQLIDSTPAFSEAWNKRATIHYLMGNLRASVADIRETLALEPRHFGAISGLGMIFIKEGNMQAALDAFEQVLLISPKSSSAQQSIEFAEKESGREI